MRICEYTWNCSVASDFAGRVGLAMFDVQTISVGTLSSGTRVGGHRVFAGDFSLEVWDYGAHLVAVHLPTPGGHPLNVVVPRGGLDAYDNADRSGYMGATIGRYANRIGDSRFMIDGNEFLVAPNEGRHALHGGPVGFDQAIWASEPVADAGRLGVRHSHHSADDDQGFPGNLNVAVTYWLASDGELRIEYEATTDAPTIVGLTNHAYWNLAGGGTISDHTLQVHAEHYVGTDEESIPTDVRSVADSRYDLRSPTRLSGGQFAAGFDDCWVLEGNGPAAVLADSLSGRSMTVSTDQPGLQVYTANELSRRHCGVALETQSLPDTPNRPDFGSALLRPGGQYRHETVHRFSL